MNCERCEHLVMVKAQEGFMFRACFCPPYKGISIGEIKECPINKEIF